MKANNDRQKKVFCFVLGNYFEQVRGGAEYQAYLLCKELKERGHEVHYIYVDNGSPFTKGLDIHLHAIRHAPFLSGKLGPFAFIFDAPGILALLRDINPDVIYQRTGRAHTGIAAYFAKRNNKCCIWHIALDRDVIRMKWSLKNFLQGFLLEKRILEWGIRHVDIIFAQADYQNKFLKQNYGRECTGVIRNFHPLPEARCSKGVDVVNISWVANLKGVKQPVVALDAARQLADIPNIRFYFAGRMEEMSANDREVFLDGVSAFDNIEYLGELSQNEVNALLDRTHIFVNTSIYEGFPNTFIQAWMRCVPVISLNVDPDDLLAEKGIGMCSGSLPRFVEDCRRLIEDSALRDSMGEKACTYAVNNHSLKRNVDLILDAISDKMA